MKYIHIFLALLSFGFPSPLRAATYDVGAGQPFLTLASLPVLQPGDIVNIQCGTYHEVRIWAASGTAANPITLRGVCSSGRPVIDGSGLDTSGNGGPRGDWEIQGAYYQIENMEFKNARNGNNGAGLRIMNAWVTVTNCKMDYNDMGIMTSTTIVDNVLIQNTEIAYNGTGASDGLSHNVYLTSGGTITFSYCYIHDSVSGENFKSRAHYTQLFYNYIAYGAESEVEGVDLSDTVGPNSNMTMIGNLLVSTPNRTMNTTKFINFGQDDGGTHNGTLVPDQQHPDRRKPHHRLSAFQRLQFLHRCGQQYLLRQQYHRAARLYHQHFRQPTTGRPIPPYCRWDSPTPSPASIPHSPIPRNSIFI